MSNKVRVAKRLVKNFFISWKHDGAKVTYQRVISTFKYGPQDPPIAEIMEDKIQSYDEGVYEGYVKSIEENNISRFNGGRKEFVEITKTPFVRNENDTKIIAWYLPQYYQIDINNKYHGQGFTEWTNSSQAIPLFAEHYQPHIPYDVGYYDLLNPTAMMRQAELAKMYGIYGFCFHWYWFSGERTMEKPCEMLLEHKEIDLKFCFDWATENWTSAWDGGTKEVIFEQKLLDGDDRKFMDDILPYMQDDRYIKIDGKPVLSIYRCDMFPKKRFIKMIENLRKYAREAGFPDLYIMITNRENIDDVAEVGADALVEFPPAAIWPECGRYQPEGYVNPNFKGDIFDLTPFVQQKKYLKKYGSKKVFRSALVGFDNTARRATTGCQILMGANPANFKLWLKGILEESREIHSGDENIVFINNWNEWAEGSHLEPDMKYGYAYLQATKEALEETRGMRYDIVENQWKEKKAKGVTTINFYVHCVESMGDIVACEPIARYLKEMDQQSNIKWLVKKPYVDLIKYNPNIDEVIPVECLSDAIDICDKAKKEENNIIVDCHYDGRICSKTFRVHSNKNNPSVNEKTYFNYGSLLANFCLSAGLPPIEDAPRFYFAPDVKVPVELPDKYVVFHCKSAESTKDWVDNKWNTLAHDIMDAGCAVVEIGMESVVKNKNTMYYDCTNIRDLQQIAAIIKGACCFIGIDSGFAHFANCLDVYGILIFGKYKTFDYPMVYSGKYKDGSNATIIYADQKPAAEVEESKVLEVFMKHMYPEGRSIHSETGEEVKKPELKIVTEEDVKDSLKGYVPFQNISVDLGGEYGNISYAQFGDDMTIMNLTRQLGLDKPSYLDIGAHHPYVMSNTAMLYQKGCRGINVEADKELLTAFVQERAEDINIHAVVAGKKGNEIFYHIGKAPGCSTIIQKRAEDFVKEMPEYGPIDEQKVTTVTIDDIVSNLCEGGSYPDFLNINIGGNEYDVLAGSDLLYSNGPAIIDVEVDGREHEKFKTLLEENDYFFYTRLGVNEIYVRNKYKDRIVS